MSEMQTNQYNLKNSLLDLGKERQTKQNSISFLRNEIARVKNLQSSHQDEIARFHQKLSSASNARDENLSPNIGSKLNAFFVKTGILKSHYDKMNFTLNDFTNLTNGITTRMAANEQKGHELEKAIMKTEFKSKYKSINKQLSEVFYSLKSGKEFGIKRETELSSKFNELEKKCEIERKEICDDYSLNLNQHIQDYRLYGKYLEEQISVNGKVNEELESCTDKNESINSEFQEKLDAFNDLKKSFDEHSHESEIALNETCEKIDTITETTNKIEVTLETLKKEKDVLAEVESNLLSEETHVKEQISEDETNILDVQQMKLVAENSKVNLLKKKADLDQLTSCLQRGKCSLENDFELLKEENESLSKKIQEEVVHHVETLSNLEIALQEETLKVGNLESDLCAADEISQTLNEELQKKATLASENAQKKEKYRSLMSEEEHCVKNKESSNKNLIALHDRISAVMRERSCEIEKLSTLFCEKEAGLESAEKQHLKLTSAAEALEQTVVELQQQGAQEFLKSSDSINMMIFDTDEKVKILEQLSEEIEIKLDEVKKKFANLYNVFNQKYRQKGALLKTTKVNFENLSLKLEKAQVMDVKLREMLAKSLQIDSMVTDVSQSSSPLLSPSSSRKVQFSSNLLKFSPDVLEDAEEKPTRSILKRKRILSDEASKRAKKDFSEKENVYSLD